MPVFYQYGLHQAPDTLLASALDTTVPSLLAQYPTRAALVHHTILADMQRQKREHAELYA